MAIFLKANWENIVMVNYEIDPEILLPYLPKGVILDLFEGKALVSVVGFLFNNTKVFGVRWPFHTNFEEVNLRYYLKNFDGQQWKRGVGFISEIVPKPIIAVIANNLYNEHYSTAKMNHKIVTHEDTLSVTYNWKTKKTGWNNLSVEAGSNAQPIKKGSEEEFIFENYYGYNGLNKSTTIKYGVEHPRWQVYPVKIFQLQCDVSKLYGPEFVPFIENVKPHSVFLAKGS